MQLPSPRSPQVACTGLERGDVKNIRLYNVQPSTSLGAQGSALWREERNDINRRVGAWNIDKWSGTVVSSSSPQLRKEIYGKASDNTINNIRHRSDDWGVCGPLRSCPCISFVRSGNRIYKESVMIDKLFKFYFSIARNFEHKPAWWCRYERFM